MDWLPFFIRSSSHHKSVKTIIEIIHLSEKYLLEKGIRRARREAEDIIADILNVKRMDLYLQFEQPLIETELKMLRNALKRRANHEPRQYIRGEVAFAEVTIKVTPAVLIPRFETEILVEKISTEVKEKILNQKILWDICTGSGCIAIALKKRFPELLIFASDLCPKALDVARENARMNQVEIEFLEGDLLDPFQNETCDFLVSNPPYISQDDYLELEPEVKNFEPRLALVAGISGLECYHTFSKKILNHVRPGGKAWLEIGAGQGKSIQTLFEKSPGVQCHYESDWSGNDRFFFLERDPFIR
jgi:release factor glutamine methyltransferase